MLIRAYSKWKLWSFRQGFDIIRWEYDLNILYELPIKYFYELVG